MTYALAAVAIEHESDVVLARQRARQIAARLGFETQDQARIATAVSEIARNAFRYAGGGRAEFNLEGNNVLQELVVVVNDHGEGIEQLTRILEGRYQSATGMGLGLLGARRLMDRFEVNTEVGAGTSVTLGKRLPQKAKPLGDAALAAIAAELAQTRADDSWQEVQRQNQELLRALDELTRRQEDIVALNRELEDTNRGVVALYAELDERADHLRRADELKSRFLSNMSHEFRTPVNSIQALTRMLLDRLDGDLTPEQERQVGFIRKAADSLSELVNDLLDLAKVEAGMSVVRPAEFEVAKLFGALRGMLRPLLLNESVNLIFEEAEDIPPMYSDEAKVSQILRNFVSNALKFTERGEVRVSARMVPRDQVEFTVSDTGIGIAAQDQERIFQAFGQIENPLQRHVKGTGLGLPLCRKLAELLGGQVTVESTPQVGSIFRVTLPLYSRMDGAIVAQVEELSADKLPILIVAAATEAAVAYAGQLADSAFQALVVRSAQEARVLMAEATPRAIVLDVASEDVWSFLTDATRKRDHERIPIVIVTNAGETEKGIALGADACCPRPVDRTTLLETLSRLTLAGTRKVLVVDDEEISRYLLRQNLAGPGLVVVEAKSGLEGVRLARQELPDAICLDLTMPDIDGFEVMRRLKADPATAAIPVIVVTSRALEDKVQGRLHEEAAAVISKDLVAELPSALVRILRNTDGTE